MLGATPSRLIYTTTRDVIPSRHRDRLWRARQSPTREHPVTGETITSAPRTRAYR